MFTDSNGTNTFKSDAAYFEQGGLNLCLEDHSIVIDLETCTSTGNQQFTRIGVS